MESFFFLIKIDILKTKVFTKIKEKCYYLQFNVASDANTP